MPPVHPPPPPPTALPPTDLLRLARDAVRRAGATAGHDVPAPTLVEQLGLLSAVLAGAGPVLDALRAELGRRDRAGTLGAVDGVFADASADALATLDLWSDRARTAALVARDAVDNAHVATAGLADVHRGRARSR